MAARDATVVDAQLADDEGIEILILGEPGVGKTAFLNRLLLGDANPRTSLNDADQPFELHMRHCGRAGGASQRNKLLFSDTASPRHYSLHAPQLLIVAFDISRASTLHLARTAWKRTVDGHFNKAEKVPVLLLGLKRDLRVREENPRPGEFDAFDASAITLGGHDEDGGHERNGSTSRYEERSVMPQEALAAAQGMRADRYAECSALTGECWDVCAQDVLGMAVRSVRDDGGRTQGAQCSTM